MRRVFLLVVAMAVLAFVGSGISLNAEAADPGQKPMSAEKVEHLEVSPSDTCDGCHAEMTPEVHQAWFASKHGLSNIKCFVCHGSAGDDFVVTPPVQTCETCHFEQVEALAKSDAAGRDCFSCHLSHVLNPHMDSGKGETP